MGKSLALKIDGHILNQTSADFDIEDITELLNDHGFKFIGWSDIINLDEDDELIDNTEDIGDDIK
jgi:hypothetical protein